jgi:hypothetical protein
LVVVVVGGKTPNRCWYCGECGTDGWVVSVVQSCGCGCYCWWW